MDCMGKRGIISIMEAVADKIIEELKYLAETEQADSGILDIVPVQAVFFGDPGIIQQSLYPCITVQPESDVPIGETTGYDKRSLRIEVSLLIDAREYFDVNVDEAIGDRALVQATYNIARWFRRPAKRTLDQLPGVVEVAVEDTIYRTQDRNIPIKLSRTVLVVQKNYAKCN